MCALNSITTNYINTKKFLNHCYYLTLLINKKKNNKKNIPL